MPEYVLDWNKYTKTAITIAEEGSVLLKNDREALPLNSGAKAAVFGRMQNNYYKSGTGSGGMVNVKHVISILEGLRDEKEISLDEELIRTYEEWESKNPVDPGMGWGKENWSQPEMPLSDDLVKAAAERNDAAIIVIARTAGEDRDNTAQKGSFFLSDGEEEMIQKVCKAFPKTIVLLNVGNIIDMSFVEKYDPAAVMYVWQAGMIGGTAVVNLVTGKAVPSGSLTDTIAKALPDYPSSSNFGQDVARDFYAEDIFVGYRYFSTFAPEKVLYPFGFGLSYTSFEIGTPAFSSEGTDVSVKVTVKNTGACHGKKTVMLFAEAPSDRFAMPKRVLVDFAKTKDLMPGQEQVLTLKAGANRYSAFDDDGRLMGKTGWVLPKGTYTFYVGENAADGIAAGSVEIAEDTMVEELESAFKPVTAFDRLTLGGKYEPAPLRTINHLDTRLERLPKEIAQTGDKGIKLADVKNGKNTLEEFIAQIPDEDLALIIRGEGMSSPKVTTGTAAAYGGVSKELKALGIPTICCDDGPSGMRIDSGKKAFAIPNGTCLACSFNEELNEELFTWFGIEMISNEVDVILGPGINIHRHPLNGRNFEYFSEDPLLTGRIASAQIKGLEKHGVTATIKHFCANNRETNRRYMDSIVSERALREIYLKGFEIAIKEGKARSVMSVYNMINGCFGTSNYELNTIILHDQWGYTGLLMTDWWAFIQETSGNPFNHGNREHSLMARAQCDVYMVCPHVEREALDATDTYENLKSGRTDLITRAELQRNAANILRFAMHTPAMDAVMGNKPTVKHIDCPFADDTIEAKVDVYFDIDKDPVIKIDVDTSDGKDYVFGITTDKHGLYTCEVVASSELSPLAQLPVTAYYTSIPMRVITFTGTDGEVVTKETEIGLLNKHSIFRLHFGKRGLKLHELRFTFKAGVDEIKFEDM
ncbi:MAG: glycoside hydrolase family 3 C-terminal domain-containing protein [Saccharofermentanaceae bacterium]|nr:glycoside hydrolase family 3 C-terminal domain-containing protein [Saccharofermentanaceae bacterium]